MISVRIFARVFWGAFSAAAFSAKLANGALLCRRVSSRFLRISAHVFYARFAEPALLGRSPRVRICFPANCVFAGRRSKAGMDARTSSAACTLRVLLLLGGGARAGHGI